MSGTLEVRVRHAADAVAAEAGGADRLEVVGSLDHGGLSPEPRVVAEIRRRTTLRLRPLVRLREGYSTDGGEATRLKGLIAAYLDAGADGLTLGFLNGLGEVDREVLGELLDETVCPWTFHRAVDACLDADRAWAVLRRLPRLDAVRTAGSARHRARGPADPAARPRADADVARLVVADGEVHPDHIPWLVRAGVRQFHVAQQVRPHGSWKAYVDSALVGSWRRLVDTELQHVHPGSRA